MPSSRNRDSSGSISSDIINLLSPIQTLYKKNIDLLIQPFGISPGQPPLLNLLINRDGMSQKELSELLHVKPASVTTMLCRLERTGIVERRKDESDHRITRVYLTPKGRKSTKKMQAVIRFLNERNLAGFRNEEKILLLRLIEQMKANMETERKELELIRNYDKGKNFKI